MSVDPVRINRDKTVDLHHVEAGHEGKVALADIPFAPDIMKGGYNTDFIVLSCPKCPTTSLHHVSGGSAPAATQALFVHIAYEQLKKTYGKTASWTEARDSVKERIIQRFPDRWQIEYLSETDEILARIEEVVAEPDADAEDAAVELAGVAEAD